MVELEEIFLVEEEVILVGKEIILVKNVISDFILIVEEKFEFFLEIEEIMRLDGLFLDVDFDVRLMLKFFEVLLFVDVSIF